MISRKVVVSVLCLVASALWAGTFRVVDRWDEEASLPKPYFGERANSVSPSYPVAVASLVAPQESQALAQDPSSSRSPLPDQPKPKKETLTPAKLYEYARGTAIVGGLGGFVGSYIAKGFGATTLASGLAIGGLGLMSAALLMGGASLVWATKRKEMPLAPGVLASSIYFVFGLGIGLITSTWLGAPVVLGTLGVYALLGGLALGFGSFLVAGIMALIDWLK